MKRLVLIVLTLASITGILSAGCTSIFSTSAFSPAAPAAAPALTAVAASGQTWDLRFGYDQAATSYFHLYIAETWAKNINQATRGRVTVELYPSDTLMKSTDALKALSKGTSDLALVIPSYFPGEFAIVDVISLPFVASTGTRASAIAWRVYEKTPEVQNAFADYKVISIWTAEPMYLHGASRNYQTLDDFKGQKIRCSAGPSTDLINRLGGNAIIFSMVDAYINLQKGVVDAIVISSEGAMGSRTYEVAPYLTYFPGPATVYTILMSRKVWDKMPADIQQAIDSVSLDTLSRLAGEVNDRARVDMVRKCQETGVALTEYNVPADEIRRWLEKAGNPMRQAWVKAMNEKGVTNARAILDEVISLSR